MNQRAPDTSIESTALEKNTLKRQDTVNGLNPGVSLHVGRDVHRPG